MKKRFSSLTKAEQEKIEAKYHRMKPEDFDEQRAHAKHHSPDAIRLPRDLITVLQAMAQLEGETHYQAMVTKWIKERLQQEARLARKYAKLPLPELLAILKGQESGKTSARA
ncbi:hypothetical protein L0337_30720 [candidate division KSB1 bacterium]|nr:hypothetical protein [candidate division KSB1 bacterium]